MELERRYQGPGVWSGAWSTGSISVPPQPAVPATVGLFLQQACLCHRENLGTVDRRVLEDPRVTQAPLEPLGRG